MLGSAIGLFLTKTESTIPDEIEQLAHQRWEAKNNKNYQLADQLRDQIQNAGYKLEDTPDGFRVRK
jgi:cysteinyl-tRNA synthetase